MYIIIALPYHSIYSISLINTAYWIYFSALPVCSAYSLSSIWPMHYSHDFQYNNQLALSNASTSLFAAHTQWTLPGFVKILRFSVISTTWTCGCGSGRSKWHLFIFYSIAYWDSNTSILANIPSHSCQCPLMDLSFIPKQFPSKLSFVSDRLIC